MNQKELLSSGYRFAFSLCRNVHHAEDLTQEAWLKLIEKKGYVENKSLLFKVIHHLFIDIYRKSKINLIEPLERHEAQLASSEIPEFTQDVDVEKLLNVLSEIENEVVFLHYYEGFSATKIGKIIRKPRGTVLSLLHRAKEKMARVANELNHEENAQ